MRGAKSKKISGGTKPLSFGISRTVLEKNSGTLAESAQTLLSNSSKYCILGFFFPCSILFCLWSLLTSLALAGVEANDALHPCTKSLLPGTMNPANRCEAVSN